MAAGIVSPTRGLITLVLVGSGLFGAGAHDPAHASSAHRVAVSAHASGLSVVAQPGAVLDHLLCYKLTPEFRMPRPVLLTDQFSSARPLQVFITGRESLCNPTLKRVIRKPPVPPVPVRHPNAHLVCYSIKPVHFAPRRVRVTNQFRRNQPLTVVTPVKVCLPSGKAGVQASKPPPIPNDLDHFLCYTVRAPPLQPPPNVTLKDQFLSGNTSVVMATLLCNPTAKRISGKPPVPIRHPAAHLVCYSIRQIRFPGLRVRIANQFEPKVIVGVGLPFALCLPSTKITG